MRLAARFGSAGIALAFVSACGASPPAPSPAPSPPPPPVFGEIVISSISPEPGATVPVRACAPGSEHVCADLPQVVFDVVIDRDIPDAVVTVNFDSCGFATTPVGSLTAGNRTSFATSIVRLSGDGPLHDRTELFCDLPTVTSRMFVGVWRSGKSDKPLLTRDFDNGYRFAKP